MCKPYMKAETLYELTERVQDNANSIFEKAIAITNLYAAALAVTGDPDKAGDIVLLAGPR
jgi:hypothetical protein